MFNRVEGLLILIFVTTNIVQVIKGVIVYYKLYYLLIVFMYLFLVFLGYLSSLIKFGEICERKTVSGVIKDKLNCSFDKIVRLISRTTFLGIIIGTFSERLYNTDREIDDERGILLIYNINKKVESIDYIRRYFEQ